MDPAQLSGESLEKWYRRSPQEIADERSQRKHEEYEAHFAGLRPEISDDPPESWREARVARPPLPTVTGSRRAPHRDPAMQGRPIAGRPRSAPGSFFDHARTIPNPIHGPAYYSDLPRPLNVVEPELGGWFRLNDNTRVKEDELERLYAEQQRMMEGSDEFEAAPHARSADRLRDGYIPRADQLAKGERELDATCHPLGGWEHDAGFPKYSERVRRYEAQITRAPGLDYVVRLPGGRVVKYDGCAVWDPKRQLLEAKGPGREWVLEFLKAARLPLKVVNEAVEQAGRQIDAAGGRPLEWHVAERPYKDVLEGAMADRLYVPPAVSLQHTPPR